MAGEPPTLTAERASVATVTLHEAHMQRASAAGGGGGGGRSGDGRGGGTGEGAFHVKASLGDLAAGVLAGMVQTPPPPVGTGVGIGGGDDGGVGGGGDGGGGAGDAGGVVDGGHVAIRVHVNVVGPVWLATNATTTSSTSDAAARMASPCDLRVCEITSLHAEIAAEAAPLVLCIRRVPPLKVNRRA